MLWWWYYSSIIILMMTIVLLLLFWYLLMIFWYLFDTVLLIWYSAVLCNNGNSMAYWWWYSIPIDDDVVILFHYYCPFDDILLVMEVFDGDENDSIQWYLRRYCHHYYWPFRDPLLMTNQPARYSMIFFPFPFVTWWPITVFYLMIMILIATIDNDDQASRIVPLMMTDDDSHLMTQWK